MDAAERIKLKADRIGLNLWAFPRKQPAGVTRLSRLSELKTGEEAILECLELPEGVSNHLMYMGFVPEARVRMVRRAPAGDPAVYAVAGIEVALRQETAKSIRVRPLDVPREAQAQGAEAVLPESRMAAGDD
jgi:Fe2+ transport system protein FeoA